MPIEIDAYILAVQCDGCRRKDSATAGSRDKAFSALIARNWGFYGSVTMCSACPEPQPKQEGVKDGQTEKA